LDRTNFAVKRRTACIVSRYLLETYGINKTIDDYFFRRRNWNLLKASDFSIRAASEETFETAASSQVNKMPENRAFGN